MKQIILIVVLLVMSAAPAAAQTQTHTQTPSDIISFLVTNESVPTGDFQKDQAAAAATRDTIERALLVNLATTPIATSSSGFVYRLDSELGTSTRVSDSFGTFFVERAMTSGQGRFALGVSGSTGSYDRLDGLNLTDGTLVTTANQFRDESAPFDTERLTLRISTNTFTVFGTYGVTDRLEIGGALPLVQLHVEGSRVNVYRGQTFVQATASGDASGMADVALRAKYRIVSSNIGGLAVASEVRFPTGNETYLLGAGRAAVRIVGVGSVENARFGVHGNAAIVRGGASNEFDGAGAITYAATPRVTVTGEFLYRRLTDLHDIVASFEPHPTIAGVDTMRLVPGTATPTLASAVSGVKWNAWGTLVVTGQIVWRLADGGLTAPFVPLIGIDYLF
jgi:hypothetical protein